MTSELDILRLVTSRLDGAGIPYMVTGSMAAAYYAEPRMTRDADLVVELTASDASRLASMFEDFNADAASIGRAIDRRSMFNLIHETEIVKVDFMVRKDEPFRKEEFRRRRRVNFAGTDVWMVTAEDLILSKLCWARDSRSELQLRDVRRLLTSGTELDAEYLNRWAKALGVADLLHEVRVP